MARMEAMPGTKMRTADPGDPTALATCTARLCWVVKIWFNGVPKKANIKGQE